MNQDPDRRLEELADAVADETPVDWDRESAAGPGRAATVTGLRWLAALASASRRFREPPADTPARILFAWGPLQALERLGEGAFGEVYRAFDPTLRREVALKLRRSVQDEPGSSARRWLEEARRLARVRHPNVLVVHGADVHDGRAGIWTDLIQGRTLEDLLVARGALSAREAALVGIDLCGALAAVHAAGLVHGDVKTRNVVREGEAGSADGSGRIVLMDFGSARDLDASGASSAFGTPLFAAPEVLEGAVATPAADLYSLGVVLYRLATARYPVEAATVTELHERHRAGRRLPLRSARPDLPAPFVQLVERALAADPGARFASAADMEQALAATLTRESPPRSRRVAVGWLLPAAALAVIAAIALWRAGTTRMVGSPPPAAGTEADGGPRTDPAPVTSPVSPGLEAAAAAPQVEATLFRVDDGLAQPLRSGDAVGPGDRLCLELESREPVHVYVLDEDERGDVFVLFPLRTGGVANPLGAGSRHRLPGREGARDLDWQVTSAGGRETFLILAARAPVAAVDKVVAAATPARAGAEIVYPDLPAAALATLRGVGGVAMRESGPASARKGRLASLARALSQGARGREIWIRMIVLENPAPG